MEIRLGSRPWVVAIGIPSDVQHNHSKRLQSQNKRRRKQLLHCNARGYRLWGDGRRLSVYDKVGGPNRVVVIHNRLLVVQVPTRDT